MRNFIQQFIRHSMVGGTAFLIDYGLLIALTEVAGMYYLCSATVSFVISVIFNYRYSMRFVFNRRNDISKITEFTIFVALSGIGLVLNTILLWLFVDYANLHYSVAKLLAAVIVTVYNFNSRKRFLENHEEAKEMILHSEGGF